MLALALVLAGCGGGDETRADGAVVVDAAAADAAAADTAVFTAPRQRETLPSSRIYYTLTDHDWYARGEPLVHENAAYLPGGMPVSASTTEMRELGEYQGVAYYTRDGDAERALYVPVFEGYWQAFRPDTAGRVGN
jgi:hypothetical protein